MIALFFNSMLGDFIEDESHPEEDRLQTYLYFGTFSRAMITTFELALANWGPICHFLVDNVGEWYGHVILLYKLGVGFAVVNVISGVFLHETFKVASSDDELMVVQKKRNNKKHVVKMKKLLQEADASSDGRIQRAEFHDVMQKENVRL